MGTRRAEDDCAEQRRARDHGIDRVAPGGRVEGSARASYTRVHALRAYEM